MTDSGFTQAREPQPLGHAFPVETHRIDTIAGVERFRRNRIVNDLVDRGGLNSIWLAVQQGKYTRAEYAEVLRLTGYSVDGLSTLRVEDDDT